MNSDYDMDSYYVIMLHGRMMSKCMDIMCPIMFLCVLMLQYRNYLFRARDEPKYATGIVTLCVWFIFVCFMYSVDLWD